MERECEDRGCVTKTEIEAAVNAVWDSLTTETLDRVVARVRPNMCNIVKMKGANFYHEDSDPACARGG